MLYFCFLGLLIISICHGEETVTITATRNGVLRGALMKDRHGGDFVAFQSIPYAQAPVRELRFKPPQPAENWKGIKDATVDISECVQTEGSEIYGREDCLYLNVYTPKVNNDSASLRPVMVYIHGGGFMTGSAAIDMTGPEFLMPKNIVLVAMNYRLGALGFLSLEADSTEISPNIGLKDQVFALKWVRDNIRQFGGDPDHVTLFGESAGSVSVHLHVLSPMSKGLFHRAIAQSGAATAFWANGAKNSALPLAKNLSIETTDPSEIVEYLTELTVESIARAQSNVFYQSAANEIPYGSPIVEGPGADHFLPDHPKNLIASGNYNKVPFILGYNNREGIAMDLYYKLTNEQYKYNQSDCVPYNFNQSKIDEITKKQREFYNGGNTPIDSKEMIELWTDVWFKYDIVTSARKHAEINPNVYLYEFQMDTELNYFKRLHPVTAAYSGASHVDELGYLFKCIYTPQFSPVSLEAVSLERMITLWTNFAIHGNPTPTEDALLQNEIWLPVKKDELNYMSLGRNLELKLYEDRGYKFCSSLYEIYDTYCNE